MTDTLRVEADVALRAARRECDENTVELVVPGDLRRTVLVCGLALVYAMLGKGWSLDHVRQNLTFTLPGARSAVDKLAMVPVVGLVLADLANLLVPRDRRATIFLSPAAMADGITLLGVVSHELGHVGDLERGGILWCLSYLLLDEVRAAAERCYGCDAAHEVLMRGRDPDEVARDIEKRITGYSLDPAHERFFKGMLASEIESLRDGVDPTGGVERSLKALRDEGWT